MFSCIFADMIAGGLPGVWCLPAADVSNLFIRESFQSMKVFC